MSIGTDVNQVEITTLSKIRGQKKVIDLLKVNLDAYFQSRTTGNPGSFGPVLLCGYSGTGKSLVAKALHAELANLDLIETNGEMLSCSNELVAILLAATENTTITYANDPPTCAPTANPNGGEVPLEVQFSANATDPENGPMTYLWDFADGSPTSTEQDPIHEYTTADDYTVTVTVTDNANNTVQGTVSVSADEVPNYPPTCAPTANPNGGEVPLEVQFSANATDPENGPMTYLWDFADGSPTSTEQDPIHEYTTADDYTVTVTVTDNANNTVQGTVMVYVDAYYVDANAIGLNNGSSWGNAFIHLQDALDIAVSSDRIWVAEGTYYPDLGTTHTLNDRTESFTLKSGVEIYGGFPEGGGSWFSRNPAVYETILSGDINIADDNTDNSYSVVNGSSVDTTAVLDGFTITAGNANGTLINSEQSNGGGMYIYAGSPTIKSCVFTGNNATGNSGDGGGLYIKDSNFMVILTDCTFTENTASDAGGGVRTTNSSIKVTDCKFLNNQAYQGGGSFCYGVDSEFINCVYVSNSASYGGGYYVDSNGASQLVNGTVINNSATSKGGGIRIANGSSVDLTNCIVWGNTAPLGPQIGVLTNSSVAINYCDIEGGQSDISLENSSTYSWNTGNITTEPFLADIPDQVRLLSLSPCIDAGDNTAVTELTDILGRDRIVDGDCNSIDVVDMGAYEFDWVMAGDFAGGCDVDLEDYAVFAATWMASSGDANYNDICDISIPADKTINLEDLWMFIENWLQ